jgi:hypothetical protein
LLLVKIAVFKYFLVPYNNRRNYGKKYINMWIYGYI